MNKYSKKKDLWNTTYNLQPGPICVAFGAAVLAVFYAIGAVVYHMSKFSILNWLFEEGYMEAAGTAGIRILYAFWECSAVLLAGLVIVYLYNGEKGSSGSGFSRWFFYIFYPAHLLLLGVLRLTVLA